jgi:hypothetical protein
MRGSPTWVQQSGRVIRWCRWLVHRPGYSRATERQLSVGADGWFTDLGTAGRQSGSYPLVPMRGSPTWVQQSDRVIRMPVVMSRAAVVALSFRSSACLLCSIPVKQAHTGLSVSVRLLIWFRKVLEAFWWNVTWKSWRRGYPRLLFSISYSQWYQLNFWYRSCTTVTLILGP